MQHEPLNIEQCRSAITVGRFEWRRHALQRLAERGIRQAIVLDALHSGDVIEDYPDDRPYPSALVFGQMGRQPIHVVVAFDAELNWAYIITAYEPDTGHFEQDFRTRRSP